MYLKRKLNSIYKKYHKPEYLELDPLVCVRKFRDTRDIEIAGLLASCLSYGRVEQIIRSVDSIITIMDNQPYSFCVNTSYKLKKSKFRGFKHRFNTGDDIAALLEAAKLAIREQGTLQVLFLSGLQQPNHTFKHAAHNFTQSLKKYAGKSHNDSFSYLLPSPMSGSACKRLAMYFRWMVRPDDGIDFGVWKSVSPGILVIPLDVHVGRVAVELGMTKRKNLDWKAAEEITSFLRTINPEDPVIYDFSLCRYGMLRMRKAME